MKRCPTCEKTFADDGLTFCLDDGTPLADFDAQADETTLVRPSGRTNETGSTGDAGPSAESDETPPYQAPGAYSAPAASTQSPRQTSPWVFVILAVVLIVFAAIGIAAVIFIPKIARESANKNSNSNSNVIVSSTDNSNRNLNNENSKSSTGANDEPEDANANSDETAPPTDQQKVLGDLKDIEDQWTAANINADKNALNRILADDYVDNSEGKPRGKADYLQTAERDSAIQHWEFEGLKLSLKGDRATLSGIIRLELKDEQGQTRPGALTFADKFVWRDGRWQATGSEVGPLKE